MSSGAATFAERFAYARWLYHGLHGSEPKQTAIAERVGRKQPTVREWYDRAEPPADYKVHEPLCVYLGVSEDWLIHNGGHPPEPVLWRWWIARRRGGGRQRLFGNG